MTLWAVDTIERVCDGIRRYILTLIYPVSAFAFAITLPSKRPRHNATAAQALAEGLPANPGSKLVLLSDDGSDFRGAFDQALQRLGLTRNWTYPQKPQNQHPRRTLQPCPAEAHRGLPQGPPLHRHALFNQKLADWLVFYNT